jgi:hypothetical protein
LISLLKILSNMQRKYLFCLISKQSLVGFFFMYDVD